jgi:hypothetical protein
MIHLLLSEIRAEEAVREVVGLKSHNQKMTLRLKKGKFFFVFFCFFFPNN